MLGKRGIIRGIRFGAEEQLGGALCAYLYASGPENTLCRSQFEAKVERVKLLFALLGGFLSLFIPKVVYIFVPFKVSEVLLLCICNRCANPFSV